MSIPFVNPRTRNLLTARQSNLFDAVTGELVAPVVHGVPRFCRDEPAEADSFGFQWNRWEHTLSDSRSTGHAKRDLILARTHFDQFQTTEKTILECGCGGGDDTEVLLTFAFSEVHAFDLSTSVDRAARYLTDERLTLSQASIFAIPYPDAAFDFVFCHRVLQHTPDPPRALRAVCRKVKPGGVLFVHSYHRNWYYLLNYKYKYRWLTKRLAPQRIDRFLDRHGERLYRLNEWMRSGNLVLQAFSWNFVPFDWIKSYGELTRKQRLELVKLITFDALTPMYDKPMRWRTMQRILEAEGFTIRYAAHRFNSPLYCTAVR